ncbi:MAG TPA: hypothetical protein VKX49_12550 [Bryobacteraceae bacterium]|nr:hypothetical protein [Bryobacteraceae bacterium]
MYTVIINVDSPDRLKRVHTVLGQWALRLNCPQWQVDFSDKAKALLAVYNLNGIPGVRATKAGWE